MSTPSTMKAAWIADAGSGDLTIHVGETQVPAIGDRVVGLIHFWRNEAAAEQASVLPSEVTRLPDMVTAIEASTLPIGALTAWQALYDIPSLRVDALPVVVFFGPIL